jgi:endonuclease YncB( thermonuclease family)
VIDEIAQYAPMVAIGIAAACGFAFYITRKPNWIIHRPLVIDGDTIYTKGLKIRIHGIDAPETGQIGGDAATAWLKSIIAKGPLTVEQTDTDQYNRVVARLFNSSGDVGRKMVQDPDARASFHTDYLADQEQSERFRRGLWGTRVGIRDPQAYRREKARREQA